MMIIHFFEKHTVDLGSRSEIKQYAVNDDGYMVQKEYSRGQPEFALPMPEAFTPNQPRILGLADFANRPIKREGKLLYTFAEMTPALISTLIFGPSSNQKYTIITDELGIKKCWSRGIQNIYFV